MLFRISGLGRTMGAATALAAALALTAAAPSFAAPKQVDPKVSSIVPGDPVALGFDPAKLKVAEDGLKADVAAGKLAGAYLLIGRHGKVAFKEGFGLQGPGQTAVPNDETIFRVFSMTKPIVAVTANAMREDYDRCRDSGMDDFVAKPFIPEELYSKLIQFLARGNR